MKKAFSLMELMVVIIILGLLATFVLPNLMGKSDEAKENITCTQMRSIAQNLDLFKLDNSVYPSSEEGLELLASKNYYKDGVLPKDSWKNDFVYVLNGDKFDIISFGPDSKEGTSDDIYLSKCKK